MLFLLSINFFWILSVPPYIYHTAWMAGVSLSERKSNEWVRSMLAIDDIAEIM